MTWARIDDNFSTHRKFFHAGPEGVAFFVAALCYSARHASDGFIPTEDLFVVYPWPNLKPKKIAERLVSVGLLDRVEGGFQVHDYLTFNESRTEILEKRANNLARQRRKRNAFTGEAADTFDHKREPFQGVAVNETRAEKNKDSTELKDNIESVTRDRPRDKRVSHSTPSRPVPTRIETTSNEVVGDARDGAVEEVHVLLDVGYRDRFERLKKYPWMGHAKAWTHIRDTARWCCARARQRPVTEVVTQLLDGAFASERMRDRSFPWAFIAANPEEFFEPSPQRGRRSNIIPPAPASDFAPPGMALETEVVL